MKVAAQEEVEEVEWVRVRRKLGSILASMDKLLENSLLSEGQAGKDPVPPAHEPLKLPPAELETLRHVDSETIAEPLECEGIGWHSALRKMSTNIGNGQARDLQLVGDVRYCGGH